MLLTLAPADATSELAAATLGPGLTSTCPIFTGQESPGLTMAEAAPIAAAVQSSSILTVPELHSDRDATTKLFLDFDGHYEAKWGDWNNVRTPAFDPDFHPESFSSNELAAIDEIWARVAEDYAPFKIDVTTADPGDYAHGIVAVIAIGGNDWEWYHRSAGGVAQFTGFATPSLSNVGFVFSQTLNNYPKSIADAASHEAGHLFGLNHQADWTGGNLVDEYNAGNADWAPIMGVSYNATRSTWHDGATDSSANASQDDMAIIASAENGFGYRADDYGDTIETAAALPVTGTNVSVSGLIGQSNDWDVWRITTGAGHVFFELTGAKIGSNLDAELDLLDGNGSVIASSIQTAWLSDQLYLAGRIPSLLNARMGAIVDAGTYYLVARGVGDYGDVGQYTITGTVPTPAPEIEVRVNGIALLPFDRTVDFGATTRGVQVNRTVSVTNVGTATLTLTPPRWIGAFGGFTLLSDIGASSLAPGESTSFSLQLNATTEGNVAESIEIANNDHDDDLYRITLRATVNPPNVPEIDVSLDGHDVVNGEYLYFAATPLNAPNTRTFKVSNLGTAPLTLGPLNETMPQGFTLIADLGSTLLSPGESTSFIVRLDATATGNFFGVISLVNNDLDEGSFWFRVNELVIGPIPISPEIEVVVDGASITDGGTIDFGKTAEGSWSAKTIAVANRGTDNLSLVRLTPSDMPSGFTLLSNIAKTSLAPGEWTFFVVRLDATAVGTYFGTIRLVNNDDDENSYDLTVKGRITAPSGPEIDLKVGSQSIGDGGTLNLGSTIQGNSVTTTIAVTNQGTTRLNLTPLNGTSMPSGFSLVSNIGVTSLLPGESTSFTIRLDAATVGSMTGAIRVSNSDSNESAYDLTLVGTVTSPQRKVVDDGDAGHVLVGYWKGPTRSGYGYDTRSTAKGKGARYSVWGFSDLPQGQYRVYATWTSNRKNASNAPFTIFDSQERRSFVRANERIVPGAQTTIGRWKLLASVTVTSGQIFVILTNAANGIVVADAVRIEQVTGAGSHPEIINVGASSSPLISKKSAIAWGQPPAIAPGPISSNVLLLPPTNTSASPGQTAVTTARPTPGSVQAAVPVGLANSQAVDGLTSKYGITRHEDSDNSVEIRDKLLASLSTCQLSPF
jgi:HYDIN/CFA65/VesB-like, Ig-like domain